MAMEGNGPTKIAGGKLLKMNLIIAGTNPLATDMVAANVMGFEANEIDTFKWAMKAGMTPNKIGDIQILGERPDDVKRQFRKPQNAALQSDTRLVRSTMSCENLSQNNKRGNMMKVNYC